LELFAYSQDRRFEKAAMEGFAYEDSCFDITQQNWPDFRNMATTQTEQGPKFSCACAWCHGAPGIGLSRLRAYELTGNPQFYQTANAAANTTYRGLQFKQLGNYSLCHGLFGNAELLLYADQVSKDTTFTQSVEAMAYDAIDKYINHKMAWPNGTQSEYNTPDFMIGMAGIGYGFLRLAEPNRFNSALILN